MTKTELQIALAAATQTDKRTATVFLDTLSSLAYKAIKIPAKTVVKFRVAKAAKDAILGAKKESGFRGRGAVRE